MSAYPAYPIRRAAAVGVALLILPALLGAQEPAVGRASPPCSTSEHREFDFWLGDWEVRSREGQVLGRNSITRIAACGLLESWRGAGGGEGVSVNAYDPARGKWTQRWVGAGGAVLWLEGGLIDGAMVLTGTMMRMTARGGVIDRLSWTPMPDGRIVQAWDTRADDTGPWTRIFEGHYHRLAEQQGGAP